MTIDKRTAEISNLVMLFGSCIAVNIMSNFLVSIFAYVQSERIQASDVLYSVTRTKTVNA